MTDRDELADFIADIHFILPNFNDTFSYACADTEQISVGDGQVLADFWRKYGWHGLLAIAAVKRKRDPLPEVAKSEKYQEAVIELMSGKEIDDEEEGWTLLDEFELR